MPMSLDDTLKAADAGAVVLLAGPTASGKSRLALALAAKYGGVVVNADSMQVYAELRVLTARPSAADEAAAMHRLYGHVPAATRYSVGAWLKDVAPILDEARRARQFAIVVGGTGLYFKALTEGLAAIPPIPQDVRQAVRRATEGLPADEIHARLAVVDADTARTIRPSDKGRIVRALEVFEATGRSLLRWQEAEQVKPVIDPAAAVRMVLMPDRALLHQRIAERARRMLQGGALAEVEALTSLGLDPELPAMKAIGVRELVDHAAGNLSRDEALAAIATETRRYAKRQMTWFRNQMSDWPRADDAATLDLPAAGT